MLEIGESLRESRRRAGLELRDVSVATRIPLRFLDAMEHDRFDALPSGLYRRSFLREYADFLGLDGSVYADEYVQRFEPAPEPTPVPAPRDRSVALAGAFAWLDPRRAGLLALIAAFGIGVWQLGASDTPSLSADPPASGHVTHVADAVKSRSAQRTAGSTRITTSPTLTLQASRGDCWLLVQVSSSHGPVLFERTLEQGQEVHFGLRQPLWIRVGAPWNLTARIGERGVTSLLPASTGEFVATRDGLTDPLGAGSTAATSTVAASAQASGAT